MENRKIIVVDSASNSKITLNTGAETFGELKAAARAAGVNFEGKDWLEGLTKTSPRDDSSILPTNVSFRGQVTNNLVYMLSNTNKKIKSGIGRKELLASVKAAGLCEAVKAKFGKNYTQVKSDDLLAMLSSKKSSAPKATPAFVVSENHHNMVVGVANLMASLDDATMDAVLEEVKNIKSSQATNVDLTDADINSLFRK